MILTKKVSIMKSSSNGTKYESFRFNIPTKWRKHFSKDDLVLCNFGITTIPTSVTNMNRITIPKHVIQMYEIEKSFYALLIYSTKYNMLTIINLEEE